MKYRIVSLSEIAAHPNLSLSPRYYVYRYGLGIATTHIRGKHYADVFRYDGRGGSIWFLSYEYGKDYTNAVRYVNELNADARLERSAARLGITLHFKS